MKKILIIEDDLAICEELKELLQNSFYNAIILKEFKDVKEQILKINPNLILLDINIPFLNGNLLLKELRKESEIPVIMVTSKNSETDEVLALSYGADDYITKPYNPNILLLHINALFKRLDNNNSNIKKYKDLEININKGSIKKDDKEIFLTKNEMIIFSYLLSKKEIIVSRDELMTELWEMQEFLNDNALTVNISRLRNKLKEVGYNDAIETRKGQGYILL